MIEPAGIQEKYSELYKQYVDLHIDDFDVFIHSRVMEFYINSSELSVDTIAALVKHALANYTPPDNNSQNNETLTS